MSDQNEIKPIYGGTIQKIKIEVDAEITAKGVVFIMLPKNKYHLHRDNVDRVMFQIMEVQNG